MKVVDVKFNKFDLGSRSEPWHDATFTESSLSFPLTQVITDEGLVGYAPCGNSKELIEGPLKDMIIGEDPIYMEKIWNKLYSGWCHPASSGWEIRALSAIDIALWDLNGKILNQPVYKLLGGDRDRVPAYVGGGYYSKSKTNEDLQKEMIDYIDMGYTAVKMKVGRISIKEDIERVKAVREAIGKDNTLMVDANHAYTVAEAKLFGKLVEEFDIFWYEEPLPSTDYEGGRELRQYLDIPIATGENEYLRWGFKDLINNRAVDIVQADPAICGGYSEWKKIAAISTANNLKLAPHGGGNLGAHAVASLPQGLNVETYPGLRAEGAKIMKFFEIINGDILLPNAPGLGLELDMDYIKKNE